MGAREINISSGRTVLVDDADYPRLSQYRWFFQPATFGRADGYAYRQERSGGRARSIRMHRDIMDAPPGASVDHRNGCGLDNRRENLRFCTSAQNNQNRHSRKLGDHARGVGRVQCGRFTACIEAGGRRHYLGTFATAFEAALAYDAAALRLHGEFAVLNYPAAARRHQSRAA